MICGIQNLRLNCNVHRNATRYSVRNGQSGKSLPWIQRSRVEQPNWETLTSCETYVTSFDTAHACEGNRKGVEGASPSLRAFVRTLARRARTSQLDAGRESQGLRALQTSNGRVYTTPALCSGGLTPAFMTPPGQCNAMSVIERTNYAALRNASASSNQCCRRFHLGQIWATNSKSLILDG
jgi:hypothetical protein